MAEPRAGYLQLVIVTPRGPVKEAEVTSMEAPGAVGQFGILPGHTPFLSAIQSGVLSYTENGAAQALAVGPGFVQVGANDHVTVLTESTAWPSEVQLEEVIREEQDATAGLEELSPLEQPDRHLHLTALKAWARARRELIETHRPASR